MLSGQRSNYLEAEEKGGRIINGSKMGRGPESGDVNSTSTNFGSEREIYLVQEQSQHRHAISFRSSCQEPLKDLTRHWHLRRPNVYFKLLLED